MSGSVQFGSVMPDGSVASSRFTTAGLTAGIDWRVHEDLIVGAAVGYGSDRSDDRHRSAPRSNADERQRRALCELQARSIRGSSMRRIGYGQLGYDNRRFVADDGVTVARHPQRQLLVRRGQHRLRVEIRCAAADRPMCGPISCRRSSTAIPSRAPSAELLTFGAMKFHSVGGTRRPARLLRHPDELGRADADRARGVPPGARRRVPADRCTTATSARA